MAKQTETLLRMRDVKARVGLSKTHLYRLMRRGLFPTPVKLGEKAVAWQASLVDRWIADRIKASEAGNAA